MKRTEDFRGKIDFGIITVIADEQDAVVAYFGKGESISGGRIYTLHTVVDKDGIERLCAHVRCPDKGQGHAQQTADALIRDLDPAWVFCVGIAGAVPDREFTLGDVLLVTRIADFSVTTAAAGGKTKYDLRGEYAHPDVSDFLAHLIAIKSRLAGWSAHLGAEPKVPLTPSLFTGDAAWNKDLRANLREHFPKPDQPTRDRIFWPAPLATSNAMMKDPERLQFLKGVLAHVMGVDMEIGGIYLAARRPDSYTPVLGIKGISDIVGYKKNGAWTGYACQSAAALAYALVQNASDEILHRKKKVTLVTQ